MDQHTTGQETILAEVERILDLMLDGRFDQVPEGEDAITSKLKKLADQSQGRAFNELKRVVDMSVTANNGVTRTAEMMRAVREVDHRTHSIASAAEEMVSSVSSISASSESAATEAEQVSETAKTGMDASQRAVKTMSEIARAVQDAAAKVDSLSEASNQIGQIVQEIEAIAKQTNLLALNATIEAARAGEAGKGFAVVANEVKNLANQTAKSTDDIRSRIDHLRSEMGTIVTAMEEGASKVEQGQEVIQSTGDEMNSISEQIHTVNDKMQEIAHILGQQSQASQEISEGITVIARMSSENVNGIGNLIDTLEETDKPIMSGITELMELGLPYATVQVAKSDHMIWMRKLAEMMAGRMNLNPKELSDHHSCRLGKWYDAQTDPALTGKPAWKKLQEPHKRVHAAGIRAAELYDQGDFEGALDKVQEAGDASKDVMRLLDELAQQLGSA